MCVLACVMASARLLAAPTSPPHPPLVRAGTPGEGKKAVWVVARQHPGGWVGGVGGWAGWGRRRKRAAMLACTLELGGPLTRCTLPTHMAVVVVVVQGSPWLSGTQRA